MGDEIGRRDAQEPTAVRPAQGVHHGGSVVGRDRDVRERVGAHRLEQLGPYRADVHADSGTDVGDDVEEIRVPDEIVPESGRRAEDRDETTTHDGVVRMLVDRRVVHLTRICEQPAQIRGAFARARRGVAAERLAQPDESEQSEVWIGGLAHGGEHLGRGRDRSDHGDEIWVRAELLGTRGVGETEPGETACERGGPGHVHSAHPSSTSITLGVTAPGAGASARTA